MTDIPRPKKNLPRHSAGSMELKEGTGPITTMCSCGNFLEIYKCDKTFRVQTPESIDPHETNPNAPWVASPVADVGSSNLIVARVLLQAREILDAAGFEEAIDKDAVTLHMHTCKETLLACEKVYSRIAAGVDAIIKQINEQGVSRDNHGRGLNPFPQVPDLNLDCAAFLTQVNRTIKLFCELPSHFLKLERIDSNFDHLGKRVSAVVGEEAPLATFIRENAETVRYLIDLRNFHEHPKQIRTVVENFRVLPNGQIQSPVWYLDGQGPIDPRPIKDEAAAAIDFLREVGEVMFIHLVMACVSRKLPYVIQEVPDDKLAPELPIRYRLSIDVQSIHLAR